MKIAVTGFEGRLGSALVLAGCEPLNCDITKPETIRDAHYNKNFGVIINCAALTDVDAAEDAEMYEKFIQVNTRGVQNLRDNFSRRIIHISTDYVFSGETGPYKENARMEIPVNNYGFSKLGGEAVMIASACSGDTIVRTTGLFGNPHVRTDLLEKIILELQNQAVICLTDALRGNQTYIPFLAEHLIQLAEMENPPRLLNLASKDIMSRYGFGLVVASVFGFDRIFIKACDNGNLNWKAKRPTKGGLDVSKSIKLGFIPYTIVEGLQDFYRETHK